MSIASLHKLDKVVLPSSVEFSNITNQRWVAGITSMLEHPAGHVHPMFRANMSQKPLVDFTTTDLDILLVNIGVGGTALGSTATYFKLATATGSAARNASSHRKITIPSSVGFWQNVRLMHNGKGEGQVILQAVYDGANDPFVYAGSQTLSGNLAAGSRFGAGPVSINGVALPAIQEISIDSGVRLIQEGGESEEFDTFVGIEITEPAVTIRTKQMFNWSTLGLRGTALNGSSGLVFYARKFSPSVAGGLSRVANNVSGHIQGVMLNGSVIPVDTTGEGTTGLTDTIRCEGISGSDSVAPITFALSTIS